MPVQQLDSPRENQEASMEPMQQQLESEQGYFEQLQHQLFSLEVSLQDAYRNRLINQQDYQLRSEIVQGLSAEIKRMQLFSQLKRDNAEQEVDLGLPRIDSSTDEEQLVCRQFLGERTRLAERLARTASEVVAWLEEAARGQCSWIATTLRLSKLRKQLGRIDFWNTELEDEHHRLNAMMERLVLSVKNRHQRDSLIANLKGLTTIFHDLNQLTGRVAKLKDAVQREQDTIAHMELWLNERERELCQGTSFSEPPTLNDLTLWETQVAQLHMQPVAETADRLKLAKEFIAKCIDPAPESLKAPAGASGDKLSVFTDEDCEHSGQTRDDDSEWWISEEPATSQRPVSGDIYET